MPRIFINPAVLEAVRIRVSQKATGKRNDEKVHITNYDPVEKVLSEKFNEGGWKDKITSCAKFVGVRFVKEESSIPYHTFIQLCMYLGLNALIDEKPSKSGKKKIFKYSGSKEEILDFLFNTNVIEQDVYDAQLLKWKQGQDFSDEQFYNMFCALPDGDVGVGHAVLNFIKKTGSIKLTKNDRQIDNGMVSLIDGNVFVHFPSSFNKFQSFLSLIREDAVPIDLCDKFYGYYCGALVKQNGLPFATKVILTKANPAVQSESPRPSDEITFDLCQQILHGNKSINSELFKSMCGFYEGYWLVTRTNLNIIKFSLHISEDGKCEIKGPNRPPFKGVVTDVSTDTLLKLGFGINVASHDYLLNIVFDLKQSNQNCFDGVYSGWKPDDDYIIAGRIRIYPVLAEMSPQKIVVNDFDDLPKKERELIDFFVGGVDGLRSQLFLQPNIKTFKTLFPFPIDNVTDIVQFNGHYTLYRLDSKKQQINRYHAHIKNGIVDYELMIRDEPRKYSGVASFKEGCLTLNIFKRGANKYNAFYNFFIGGRKTSDYEFIKGVYATAATPGIPYCGRAVMTPGIQPGKNKPIEIFSEEYFHLDKGLRALLTGVENNLIKVNTEMNDLRRKLNYGEIFFNFACFGADDLSKKVRFLRQALFHNFDDIPALKKQLEEKKPLYEIKKNELIDIKENEPEPGFCRVLLTDLEGIDYRFVVFPSQAKPTK